jgi:hypothetical protein
MRTFDIESFVGPGESFAVHWIAKRWCCSAQHIRNLIEEGAIKVPPEEIARARSKQKTWTTVRVPRKSLIDFLRIRSSRRWWNTEKKKRRKLRAIQSRNAHEEAA